MEKNHSARIFFRLEPDEDGYPPVSTESVWGIGDSSGLYMIDNIPFFADAATLGDIVAVEEIDGTLWFSGLRIPSGNSLVRVILRDPSRKEELVEWVAHTGCECEQNQHHNMIAISVPSSVRLALVQSYLQAAAKEIHGWLDYEEPILRQ